MIISLDDKDIKTMKDIDSVKKEHKAGDTVEVIIIRSNAPKKLQLTSSEEK